MHLFRRFLLPAVALLVVFMVGTVGYYFLATDQPTLFDAFYMTVITIATIGYEEVVPLGGNTAGRVFTVFIALSGIGILTYMLSNITAFVVEGELKETFRRSKMEKKARHLKGHFIVCGTTAEALHVVGELRKTQRPHVVVDDQKEVVNRLVEEGHNTVVIEGDPTDNTTLEAANIADASGLFATTGEDNRDLVICLTARHMAKDRGQDLRIVCSCVAPKNVPKMRNAGADAVVSTKLIGGLRMASEMVRPTVVTFLDTMLRDQEKGLRVEEISAPAALADKTVADMKLRQFPGVLLMAVQRGDDWAYNPPQDYLLKKGDQLIVMTPADERKQLEEFVQSLS